MEHPEVEAFDSADRAAAEDAMPVLHVMRKMTPAQVNERSLTFLISELIFMIDTSNWEHAEHARDVSDLLSSAVYILENTSDEKIREGL